MPNPVKPKDEIRAKRNGVMTFTRRLNYTILCYGILVVDSYFVSINLLFIIKLLLPIYNMNVGKTAGKGHAEEGIARGSSRRCVETCVGGVPITNF